MRCKLKKYLEKKIRKYVLATVDKNGKSFYMKKTPTKTEYSLVEDIEIATKSKNIDTANLILDFYYQDMGTDIQFVPIPIDITYEIVEE